MPEQRQAHLADLPCSKCGIRPRYVCRAAVQAYCRPCLNERNRLHYNDPANASFIGARNNRARLKRYGLTAKSYKAIVRSQRGKCPVCRKPLSEKEVPRFKHPHIDHDHETGKVRGILHYSCNLLLGHAGNDPRVLRGAIDYLRRNGVTED